MLKIIPATTPAHFHQALTLIEELVRGNARQASLIGLDGEARVRFFYADKAESRLMRECAPPEGCLLIARVDDAPAGCVGFKRIDSDTCELIHLFVRDANRRQGIGLKLVEQLVLISANAGYHRMLLETAFFMTSAHRIYESVGFKTRGPYRTIPDAFLSSTVCMELSL